MNNGTIIFLNGTSSSGKTSLSNELLQLLGGEYMYLSVDNAIAGVNDMLLNMFGTQLSREEVQAIERDEMIETPVISLFHHYIAAFCRIGKNIVVDHVLVEPGWLKECVELLQDTRAYFVGVRCPLDELERRERARGDRPIGLAKAQIDIVHRHGRYDIEVHTNERSARECALQIKHFIETNPPGAFRVLSGTGTK